MKEQEYKDYIRLINRLWNSLNQDQKSDLWALWDNGILQDKEWESILDHIIKLDKKD